MQVGDLVYQRDGSHSAIQSIDIEEVDGQRVCNLTIHELHNYAVGKLATLVHNGCKKADVDASKTGAKGKYSDVGGHHVHGKAGFKNAPQYSKGKGFSVSQDYMKSRGWDHQSMTNKQRELFNELAKSGRPNTLREHTRIAGSPLRRCNLVVQQGPKLDRL